MISSAEGEGDAFGTLYLRHVATSFRHIRYSVGTGGRRRTRPRPSSSRCGRPTSVPDRRDFVPKLGSREVHSRVPPNPLAADHPRHSPLSGARGRAQPTSRAKSDGVEPKSIPALRLRPQSEPTLTRHEGRHPLRAVGPSRTGYQASGKVAPKNCPMAAATASGCSSITM